MVKIARRFQFEASHALPYHDGKCRGLHGHSYVLELIFEGVPRALDPAEPQSGFVVDFGRLRELVQGELIDRYLDHAHLNDSVPGLAYSSAEHLVLWIVRWCIAHLEGRVEWSGVAVVRARLWESASSWAEVTREEALSWAG